MRTNIVVPKELLLIHSGNKDSGYIAARSVINSHGMCYGKLFLDNFISRKNIALREKK